jgi:multidrug efflux pump subunit AcrA (membrane-fusion protein)
VTAAELGQLKPGLTATLISPNGKTLTGVVRAIAPTVDPHTLTGLVYVDLPDSVAVNVAVSAGMFARGEFQLGQRSALTLPQSAVLLREGFAYVFQVETGGHGGKINQRKIMIGRRLGERIEVSGLDAQAEVVASGVGFLADGDSVSIVPALTLSPKQP